MVLLGTSTRVSHGQGCLSPLYPSVCPVVSPLDHRHHVLHQAFLQPIWEFPHRNQAWTPTPPPPNPLFFSRVPPALPSPHCPHRVPRVSLAPAPASTVHLQSCVHTAACCFSRVCPSMWTASPTLAHSTQPHSCTNLCAPHGHTAGVTELGRAVMSARTLGAGDTDDNRCVTRGPRTAHTQALRVQPS